MNRFETFFMKSKDKLGSCKIGMSANKLLLKILGPSDHILEGIDLLYSQKYNIMNEGLKSTEKRIESHTTYNILVDFYIYLF